MKKKKSTQKKKPKKTQKKTAKSKSSIFGSTLLCAAIIAFVFGLAYVTIFDSDLDMNGDNYSYLLLSRNILDGHGYSDLRYDGTYKPASWFPPGYPYILAAATGVIGDSIIGLKSLNGLFFLASALLFFFFTRKMTGNTLFALAVAVLLVLNKGLLRNSTIIMSEIPYVFFSFLAIFAVVKIDENNTQKPFYKSAWFYTAIVASIIAYYTRSFGIVLILAIAVHWLSQKNWKLAGGYLAGNAILFAPYWIRNKIHGFEGRYSKMIFVDNPWRPEEGEVSTVSGFIEKLITNLNDTILHGFPHVLFPTIDIADPSSGLKIFGVVVVLLAFFGVYSLKKYRFLLGSFLLFSMGVLLLWHTGNGVRYVWPMVGIIMLTSFYGLLQLLQMGLEKSNMKLNPKYIGLLFLTLTFLHIPNVNKLAADAKGEVPNGFKNYFELARQFKAANSNSSDLVVVCRKPKIFAYYGDARTTNYVYSQDDKEVLKGLVEKQADYVVLDQLGFRSTYSYLLPAVQKNQPLFQTVMHIKNPDTYLLKFDLEKARSTIE